jgi:polyisoprenoid-binding protein YceI
MSDQTTASPATRTIDGVEIPVAGIYDIDVAHTSISFSVRHLMVSKTHGRFEGFTGTVTIAEDPKDSQVEVSIDVASVNTSEAKRDEHLRSADFFDVEQFPTMTFTSTGVSDHHGDHFKLTGDLTVHGVTKPVTLDAVLEGVATTPWGTSAAGFSATTEIDREAFGLTYNAVLETGGVMVGKTAKVVIEAELNRRADA